MDSTHASLSGGCLAWGKAQSTPETDGVALDVCLLMLYGHILSTSTSYTYALGMHYRCPVFPRRDFRQLTCAAG